VPRDQLEEEVPVRGVPNTPRDRVISWSFWALLIGFPGAVLLLSAHLPDALDRLPARERAVAGFLETAPVCGNAFGRVTEVELLDDPAGPRSIRYRCEWTVLGFFGRTHTAECAGGEWQYAGWLEMWSGGSC
jgi:hypothetical protein